MPTTWEDAARDDALSELHDEAIMARAAMEQAIFVFVEGDSEEMALPFLFEDVLDLCAVGAKLANYNGRGNLRAALRLLRLTLDHSRPVVVTHDNDPESIISVNRCAKEGLLEGATHVLPLPVVPVVTYPNGHVGGAFEECFPVDVFLDAAFTDEILPRPVVGQRGAFERFFDPTKPWFAQLRSFCAENGVLDLPIRKPLLAKRLANSCDDLPLSFSRLVALIRRIRAEHPVTSPTDVELPRVHGLTYFPEKETS